MSAGKGNPGYPITSFGKLALKRNLKTYDNCLEQGFQPFWNKGHCSGIFHGEEHIIRFSLGCGPQHQ